MKKNLRRALCLLLLAGFLTSLLPPVQAAEGYSDVPRSHWAYESVMAVTEAGLFDGVGRGRFHPQRHLTRAAFVTVLARFDGADLSAYQASSFRDVPPAAWYGPAVEWAYRKGIVNGTGNGLFSPEQAIRRQDAAVMLIQYFNVRTMRDGQIGYPLPRIVQSVRMTDRSDCSDYALEKIIVMYRADVLRGYADGAFRPKKLITRAEGAAIFHRCLELVRRTDTNGYPVEQQAPLYCHAGIHNQYPRNSMESYVSAVNDYGYRFVETDVKFTKDEVAVCAHDNDLYKATQNEALRGKTTRDFTYAELLQFPITDGIPGCPDTVRIMKLADFLSFCRQNGLSAILDVKTTLSDAEAKAIFASVRAAGMEESVIYSQPFDYMRSDGKYSVEALLCNAPKSADIAISARGSGAVYNYNNFNAVMRIYQRYQSYVQQGRIKHLFIGMGYSSLGDEYVLQCLRNQIDFAIWSTANRAETVRHINSAAYYIESDWRPAQMELYG